MSEKKDSENQKYFQHGWLTEPEFKEWLAKVKDTTTFRCFAYNKTLELSTSGRSALTDHAKGEKLGWGVLRCRGDLSLTGGP